MWKLRLFKSYLISGDSQGAVIGWDAQHGTLIKQFNNLKGYINALEVNESFKAVYASGTDSRVVVIQLNDRDEWVFASIYRG